MRLRGTLATLGYLISVVFAPSARAADPPVAGRTGSEAQPGADSPSQAQALQLFEQSATAYNEGRFQDAIELLLEARRAKKEPVLLYNLGRAYEAMGRPAEAADAYAEYLAEAPLAADRRAIEGRIATLRAQSTLLESVKHTPSHAPTEPAPAAAPAPRPSMVPWVILGVGVAGLGAGATFGFLSNSRNDAAKSDPVQLSSKEKLDESASLATVANVGFVAGGVITLVGLVWLGLRLLPTAASRSSARLTWTSTPGRIVMQGTF